MLEGNDFTVELYFKSLLSIFIWNQATLNYQVAYIISLV